jgi:hypothetical protein
MESENLKSANFIKSFWLKYEAKIVLAGGLILVAVISFEFGLMQGKKRQLSPLIIEKAALAQNPGTEGAQGSTPKAPNSPQEAKNSLASNTTATANCAFAGSKNSNKYHLATCRWAKQIKPENIVCFSSADEAAQKGYQPDKNCIK